jgi:2'-hydroxyisoflavone reductase
VEEGETHDSGRFNKGKELMKVLVLGGSRFIGAACMKALHQAGHQVTVFNRGSASAPDFVDWIKGDRLNREDLSRLASHGFDAVVDTSGYQAEMVELASRAFAGKVGRYLFLSTVAVYQPSQLYPWTEDHVRGFNPLWGAYAEEKIRAEEILEQSSIPSTILRSTYVIGRGDYTGRIEALFQRIRQGHPILLPDGGNAVVQLVDHEDLAQAMVLLLASTKSLGQVYNVANPEGVTLKGLVECVVATCGCQAMMVPFSMEGCGISAAPYDLKNNPFPFANEHFLFDIRKLENLVGTMSWKKIPVVLQEIFREQSADQSSQPVQISSAERQVLNQLGL